MISTLAASVCTAASSKYSANQTAAQSFAPVRLPSTAANPESIQQFRLKSNGLHVVLCERHAAPVASVMVVYHVGSRNEAAGYTGATHFLEHLMFKGTARFDPRKKKGIDDLLRPLGGYNNATTSFDRTNYFEVVPKRDLDLCLDIESDRMRHLSLRQTDRGAEMAVVRNELESAQDDAQNLLQDNLFATAYREHPYHHPTLGWRSDVESVPTSRLRQFYDQFYWPNNASLIVIGDFKTDETLQKIASYFGKIPRAKSEFPKVYTMEPPQEGERRFIVRRGGEQPKLMVAFHIPKAVSADTYALDTTEYLLGSEEKKSSLLYKNLIDTGLASDVWAYSHSLRDPGLFVIYAAAAPHVPLPKLEAELLRVIESLKPRPLPATSIERAKQSIVKEMRLSCADPVGLADLISESIAVAGVDWLLDYPSKLRGVNAADIQRVANRYFSEENRTVGYYLPKTAALGPAKSEPVTAKPARSESSTLEASSSETSSSEASSSETSSSEASSSEASPSASSAAKPSSLEPVPSNSSASNRVGSACNNQKRPSRITTGGQNEKPGNLTGRYLAEAARAQSSGHFATQTERLVLSNGLTLLILPVKGTGTVAVSAMVRGGRFFRSKDKTNLPDLLADLLTSGSKHFSKSKTAELLDEMGSQLDYQMENFYLSTSTEVASEDFRQMIALIADSLIYPNFEDSELNTAKSQLQSSLKEKIADTSAQAFGAFTRALYKPECIFYEKQFDQQLEELDSITAADLRAYHEAHVTADNTVLAIVGDIAPALAKSAVSSQFGGWASKTSEKITVTQDEIVALRQATRELRTPLKDKTNTDVVLGHTIAIDVKSKDYLAAKVANAALGFDTFGGRLAIVRDKHGLTYNIDSQITDEPYPFAPWTVNFSVNPENYPKALRLVEEIIRNFSLKGLSKTELAEEKSQLAGAFYVHLRAPKQISQKLCLVESLGLGVKFIDDFDQRVLAVSASEVAAAIKNYFQIDHLVISASGSFKQ